MISRRAFTLAEVLVFIAIVSIAVLGVFSIQALSLRYTQYNRSRHTAVTLLASTLSASQCQLERAFYADPSHPRTPSETEGFETAVISVYEPDLGPASNLRRVEAFVYWKDAGETQERSISAWTYVYRLR
ncbi:prepilin-type N-terminal cleavage/methylation domain-containing protein [bacterium]|nr:prepilin-type N-terminal cleavage/methylation domain-containing protein [bacterium]